MLIRSPNVINKNIRNSQIWIVMCLVIALITLSFAPILVRLSENELGPYGTVFNRFCFTGLLLSLGRGFQIVWDKINGSSSNDIAPVYIASDFFYLILGSILEAMCQVTWAWSLKETTVANSNLLHNMTPIFAAFGGWLFLKQTFSRRFLIGTILAMVGIMIIGVQDFQITVDTWRGDSMALLSAVFYAGALLVLEHLRQKFSTTTILLWSCVGCSLLTLPCTLLLEDHLFPISPSGWFYVMGLAIFCNLIGLGALLFTLKRLSSSFIALVMLLEPIIAAFLAWVFFAEKLNLLSGLTFITILLGIYLSKPASES